MPHLTARSDGRFDAQADAAFVTASRRMAKITSEPERERMHGDPGDALLQLLKFTDAVTANQPPRAAEPLAFPVLSRLAAPDAR